MLKDRLWLYSTIATYAVILFACLFLLITDTSKYADVGSDSHGTLRASEPVHGAGH